MEMGNVLHACGSMRFVVPFPRSSRVLFYNIIVTYCDALICLYFIHVSLS